jgi:hypothetical protein
VHYLENKKINVWPPTNDEQTLIFSLTDYYLLWATQLFNFPAAKFLHLLPSFVLALHFSFFAK